MQDRASSTTTIKDFKKMLLRQLNKIEYLNVDLIPGYEATEIEYRKLKAHHDTIIDIIKDLKNYEHGTNMLKTLKNGLQYLNDQASLNVYRCKNIYEDAADNIKAIQNDSPSKDLKAASEKISIAFDSISRSKHNFNVKLKAIKGKVKEQKSKFTEIDRLLKKVRKMRFDLEVLLQDGGYNNEIKESQKNEFIEFSKTAMNAMKEFISNCDLGTIIKDILKEYKKHFEEGADILKAV